MQSKHSVNDSLWFATQHELMKSNLYFLVVRALDLQIHARQSMCGNRLKSMNWQQ